MINSFLNFFLLFVGSSWLVNTSELLVPTQDVYFLVNLPAVLNCSTNNASLLSSRHILVWTHDNQWVANRTILDNNRSIQLQFSYVSYQDRGVYICGVYNFITKQMATPLRNVSVHVGSKPQKPAVPDLSAVGWPPISKLSWTIMEAGVETDVYLSHTSSDNFCDKFSTEYFQRIPHCRRVSEHAKQDFKCAVTQYVHQIPTEMSFLCASIKTWNSFGESFSEIITWNVDEETRCSKPAALQLVRAGEEYITVSWRYPLHVDKEKYGSLFYRVSLRRIPELDYEEVKGAMEYVGVNSTYRATFDKLKCNTKYAVSVACVFDRTEFHWGEESWLNTTTLEKAPSLQVRVQRYFRDSPKSLEIAWDKLPHNGSWCGLLWVCIRYWRVDAKIKGTVLEMNLSGSSVGITIHGLDKYAMYQFTVNVCNSAGCADRGEVYTSLGQVKEPTAKQNTASAGLSSTTRGFIVGAVVAVVAVVVALLTLTGVAWKRTRRNHEGSTLDEIGGNVRPDAPHIDEMNLVIPEPENNYETNIVVEN